MPLFKNQPTTHLASSDAKCEAISQPYRFEVELISENAELDLQSLLHQRAFLAFTPDGLGIHGLIYQVAQAESGKRLTRYKLSIVPQLSYLALRTNQRIFQHLTVPQIVAQVLQEHGIVEGGYQLLLGPTVYPKRDYCVQYDESDLHFVQRLCEEEGIHYHFQHSEQGHVLLFGDDQSAFGKLGQPTAYLQDNGMTADEPVIKRFAVRLETRTSRITRRDYDFEQPRLLMEAAFKEDRDPEATPLPDLEDYDYPGRFVDRARGKHLSQRHLERHRADYRLAEGRGDQPKLLSGHFLELSDHPRQDYNDLWLLHEVIHQGKQPQVLEESVTSHTAASDGCLYHAEHVVPYDLPANKTRSVFKTLSTPGGGGYNELRIEDKKGAEQIYLHAQRDWDENIEHNQKIRVGHERHDTVEANSYTELKAEENLTVKTERKVEVKPDDHLTVGQNQHIKLGTAQLTQAGREIHLKAGQKMVIEAGTELTLKAGGSFIKLDPGGITLSGPIAKINAGGAAGKGSGIGIKPPVLPGAADSDRAGDVLEQAQGNLATSLPKKELDNRLRLQLKRPFEKDGIAGQPYLLNIDGNAYNGRTAAGGYVDHPLPPGAEKATLTFYPFGQEHQAWTWELDINKQAPAKDIKGRQSRLKNLGFYDGAVDGIDGPKTQYAARCFQRTCQLPDKDHLTASEQELLIKQHNV
jgi:uncharacterized protein involved in type VI secretion and phage assembly